MLTRRLLLSLAAVAIFCTPAVLLAQKSRAASKESSNTKEQSSSSEVQDTPQVSKAQQVADEAICLLAAYKLEPGAELLAGAKEELGASAYYKGAEGLLLAYQKDTDQALELLEKASAAKASDPAAEYYRGEVLSWKKQNKASQQARQLAHDRAKAQIAEHAEDPRAHYYLGASLLAMNKPEEARAALEAALEYGFDAAMVNLQLGLSWVAQEQWEKAKASFDTVIDEDKEFALGYYYRGLTWRKLKRTDEMTLDLNRFLKLAPDSREASAARSLLNAAR